MIDQLKCGCQREPGNDRNTSALTLCDRHAFLRRGKFTAFQMEHYIFVLNELEKIGLEWSVKDDEPPPLGINVSETIKAADKFGG